MKLVLAFFSLLLAASVWVYEIDSDVNLRKGPSNKKKILRTVAGGEKIEVLEKTNEFWWKVEYQGTEGYIASSFIVVAVPETAMNFATAAWDFIMAYPAIMGIILFLVVFGIIRKVQLRRNKRSSSK
ncbi:MAG: SH3 domain-containing protein [Cytophagales bacterium]|nr:SH3 domain-containing protein [Cytophagales bacterium]